MQVTNKDLIIKFRKLLTEKQIERINGKGLTKNMREAIKVNIETEYQSCDWDPIDKNWVIGDKLNVKRDKDRSNYETSYQTYANGMLNNWVTGVNSNILYTDLNIVAGKGASIFCPDESTKKLTNRIRKIVRNNKSQFVSFKPFNHGKESYNQQYFDKAWSSYENELVDYIATEIRRRAKGVVSNWIKSNEINYLINYVANVDGIENCSLSEVDGNYFIDKNVYDQYKAVLGKLKKANVSQSEINDTIRMQFGFNYAYVAYQFMDNNHVVANNKTEPNKVKELLFDTCVKLAIKNDNKLDSYIDMQDSMSANGLAQRMAKDNATFKLKRHQEWSKFIDAVMSATLEVESKADMLPVYEQFEYVAEIDDLNELSDQMIEDLMCLNDENENVEEIEEVKNKMTIEELILQETPADIAEMFKTTAEMEREQEEVCMRQLRERREKAENTIIIIEYKAVKKKAYFFDDI
ncbi:hypothetical protein [Enterococcus casseliflavus]|uniref:hypothetical protein n=1 Tax=Enterococcus casseliflavus TaxID=37734 RepID=UPI001BCAD0EF|nr:hypothetical protein [Enterococcus casseliflavus]